MICWLESAGVDAYAGRNPRMGLWDMPWLESAGVDAYAGRNPRMGCAVLVRIRGWATVSREQIIFKTCKVLF